MIYRSQIPQPPLRGIVDVLWHYEGYAPPHSFERVLPSGTLELVINLRNEDLRIYDSEMTGRWRTYRGALLSGVQTGFTVINTAQQERIMGVHFRPGGAFSMFGIPADIFCDNHVTLGTLWGAAEEEEIRERLALASDADERLKLLEAELLRRTKSANGMHPAIRHALVEFGQRPDPASVGDAADLVGLSARRFIELFRRYVGVTPKLYCRIRRFQRALGELHRIKRMDWSAFALERGYYDQSHFIRDFRQFSGLTPSAYRDMRGSMEPVPEPERGQICPIPG